MVATGLYRWVLANELIQARDMTRLLAIADKLDDLAQQRLRDAEHAWTELNNTTSMEGS